MMEQSGLLTEKKTDIKSLTLPELTAEMEAMGEKKFRAGQLYQWMHQKLAGDYEEMTNTEGKMPGEIYLYFPGLRQGTDLKDRWNKEISVRTV